MSEAKFQCGDVVRLKSGGTAMTVYQGDRGDGLVTTSWLDINLVLRRDAFDPRELQSTEPAQ